MIKAGISGMVCYNNTIGNCLGCYAEMPAAVRAAVSEHR